MISMLEEPNYITLYIILYNYMYFLQLFIYTSIIITIPYFKLNTCKNKNESIA